MCPLKTSPYEIFLYADGSFSCEVGIGAWAFRAVLNLEGVGSSEGKTVTRFEFLAVLHGLEAVVAVDRSVCRFTSFPFFFSLAAIEKLRAGLPLPKPGKYQDRADLLPRLQAILDGA